MLVRSLVAPTVLLAALLTARSLADAPSAGTLGARLKDEGISALAEAVEEHGDAQRGAVAFHQPTLACARCHSTNGKPDSIGPDLTQWPQRPTTADLVQAILEPSQSIRRGYEMAVIVRTDGRQQSGVLVAADDRAVVFRNASTGETTTVPADEIEEWTTTKQSLMPNDVANLLGTRQQFLDLVRYVREIADGGPPRARELSPPAALLVDQPLPEYESRLDHAGLIRGFDDECFLRGREIYERVCANCHGTHDRPGTLPTSRRFGVEPLKNGSDPYAMYQTLTRGFGMMAPQHWMAPRQKYDVIHYLREDYLARLQPEQSFALTDEYLESLPRGDTLGPEPANVEPWSAMDYGPSLLSTYEFGRAGRNIAYKGIAVRLDGGAGGVSRGRAWAVFEHDTLRLAGFWTGRGFIDWEGIHFDGRHNAHPHVLGEVHVENTGPGWADPETGSFEDDRRVVGRDGRRYGPLPRTWGRFEGLTHHGSQVIVHYRVGDTPVLESPGFIEVERTGDPTSIPVLTRTFEVGPRPTELALAVATQLDERATLVAEEGVAILGRPAGEAAEAAVAREPFHFDGRSYLEIADGAAFKTTESFTVTARLRTEQGGTIFARTTPGSQWVPGGQALFVRDGRLCYDIGWVGVLESDVRLDDGQWRDVALVYDDESGLATLFIDGQPAGSSQLEPRQELDEPVIRLGFCAPDFPQPAGWVGELRDVRFFPQALDAALVAIVADGDDPGVQPLAHWTLDEETPSYPPTNEVPARFAAVARATDDAAARPRTSAALVAGVTSAAGLSWKHIGERLCLVLAPGEEPLRFTLWTAALDSPQAAALLASSPQIEGLASGDLSPLTQGGPLRWPQTLTTQIEPGPDDGPFAVDALAHPAVNPWLAGMRLTGFDFFADGDRAAVCAWDGDVWLVEGLGRASGPLVWRRIASGLFQPLGLKIVADRIYVACRDQLAILHDLNGDGETDFYQCFNSDHQVTEHFHEFAMGLQRDAAGNFYYAKSARHALPAIVPHHGTLLRVSPDGARTDIMATGFRAANGVCLNPDGTFFLTDQEGHWTPKNRINWVREGGFYGNLLGYHDVTDRSDAAMEPPLCWLTNNFDRSPAEPLWASSATWAPLAGRLLNLSYGYGRVYVVAHEQIGEGPAARMQGGATPLPLPDMPTGLIRGRFHAADGQLYACGMFAWAGSQQQPGGFYRIRRTDRPVYLPVEFRARPGELELGFTGALDPQSATDPGNYTVQTWSLIRSENYGSEHVGERTLKISGVRLGGDGTSLVLQIPDLAPTMGLVVRWDIEAADGTPVRSELHGAIHHLR